MARINLETQLLRSFLTIHDVGGFARAADMLHMTQPAISQQMRRLEEVFDRPLFKRQGRNMRLTAFGESLLGYARRMVALNDEIAETLSAERARQVVHLGVPAHFSENLLPRVIAATARDYPDVQLVVKIGTSETLSGGIERGDIDMALLVSEAGALGDSVLCTMPVRWMVSEECDLQEGDEIPLVLFSGQCTFRRLIIRSLDAARIDWRCAYEASDLLSLRAAVRAGLGATGLPALAAADQKSGPQVPWLPALPMSQMSMRVRPGWQPRTAERLGGLVSDVLNGMRDSSPAGRGQAALI